MLCPDFAKIHTGVGTLPVPPSLARQIHFLHHNALAQKGAQLEPFSCRSSGFRSTQPPRTPPAPQKAQRHHRPPQKRSPAPLPPPSRSFDDLIRQWERLLTWATYRTLTDFRVMPPRLAREASRRVSKRILADYGSSLHKWLGQRTREHTRSGGKPA